MAEHRDDEGAAATARLLDDAAGRAARYLAELDGRAVAPARTALERLEALDGPVPEDGADPADIIALLDDVGAPATVASAGPRYFGFVTGGALPAALAANWLAGAWDQNAFSAVSSPVAAALEARALVWVAELLGLPADCGGGLVTGATMANFTGLAAARHAVLEQAGWNVEARGLAGAPPVSVVAGAEAHASLLKALALLGLGRETVIRVPADGQGRMRAEALPEIARPAIVCLQAGNVNTGAFDPAAEVIAAARAAGAWVHVDGAFGLWAAAAPGRAHLTAGFDGADSWALDAHKWLNVPYDSGIALVRRPEALAAAMSMDAAYLPTGGQRDPFDFTPEASRRMRGVEVWAALKSLGRRGLAALVERNCRQAARFAEGLGTAGFEVLNEVVLNQVLVSFGAPEATQRVIAGLQAEGTCWCGGTTWRGRPAMRISVSSWATGDRDVARSLEAMIRVARAAGA
ncbi:MAG: aminotransferase class V-fold PLP-dependent enzyme [Rhodospirillales bacterium]|nr:aminotransferase class V-fold PLP-dependent enzyme [Rhodospirillales bacterium]